LALVWLGGVVTAEAEIYFYDPVPDYATSVSFDFSRVCSVGTHEFVLEKTTLRDIASCLGGAIKGNGGDAAAGESFLDFAAGPDIVRFSSNWEMGGPEEVLDGVEVRPATATELKGLPLLRAPIRFRFGTVGMPFKVLCQRLGPAVRKDGKVYYVHDENVPLKVGKDKKETFDVFALLQATVAGGVVTGIKMTRVTSD
jgi:hypothetical protein